MPYVTVWLTPNGSRLDGQSPTLTCTDVGSAKVMGCSPVALDAQHGKVHLDRYRRDVRAVATFCLAASRRSVGASSTTWLFVRI